MAWRGQEQIQSVEWLADYRQCRNLETCVKINIRSWQECDSEGSHRRASRDRPSCAGMVWICVSVLRWKREREFNTWLPFGKHPCSVFVCVCNRTIRGGRKWEWQGQSVCVHVHTSSTPLYLDSLSIPLMKAVIIFRRFGLRPGSPAGRFISACIPGWNMQLSEKYSTLAAVARVKSLFLLMILDFGVTCMCIIITGTSCELRSVGFISHQRVEGVNQIFASWSHETLGR